MFLKTLSIVTCAILTGCASQNGGSISHDHPASPHAKSSAYQPGANVLASDHQAGTAPATSGHDHAAHAGHGDVAKPAPVTFPVDVCVVSGEKLGSMGKPVTVQHQGRTIPLCCKGCVDEFKEDPAKFTAKYDALIAAKKKPSEHKHDGHQH